MIESNTNAIQIIGFSLKGWELLRFGIVDRYILKSGFK